MHYSLSLSDLILDKHFVEVYGTNNLTEVKKILFKYGMDVSQPVEEVVRTHRNRQNKIVTCLRFEGFERIDDVYRHSGYCTTEAYIFTEDASLARELCGVGKQGFSGKFETIAQEAVKRGVA